MRSISRTRELLVRLGGMTAWWVLLAGAYITWIGSVTPVECGVAVLLATGGTAAAMAARPWRGYRLSWAWLAWLPALLASVPHDLVAAVRPRPGSEATWQRVRPRRARVEDCTEARQASAMLMLASSPGSLPVDSRTEDSELLVHCVPGASTTVEERMT